jgi:hypothetical protein
VHVFRSYVRLLHRSLVDGDTSVSSWLLYAGIDFLGRWTAILMRREVFPQVRVGEPEAGVLKKKSSRCVRQFLLKATTETRRK